MRVLALEPFHGGSHAALIAGMTRWLDFEFDVRTLPARRWNWRMRTAAVHLADDLRMNPPADAPDVVFATSLMNLAEFRAIAPQAVARAHTVFYFHENQLAYPFRSTRERDHHFGLTNILSALAADRVLFNSAFNRDSLLEGAAEILAHSDLPLKDVPERIAEKSGVLPVPIEPRSKDIPLEKDAPPLILWNHRWEHDKNPSSFFAAMDNLDASGAEFSIAVAGESFASLPPEFEAARKRLGHRIAHFGFCETRADYLALLARTSIVVSTAFQEFQGLSILEAAEYGAFPLAPRRLAYPEVLPDASLYDDDDDLLRRLVAISQNPASCPNPLEAALQYTWPALQPRWNSALTT